MTKYPGVAKYVTSRKVKMYGGGLATPIQQTAGEKPDAGTQVIRRKVKMYGGGPGFAFKPSTSERLKVELTDEELRDRLKKLGVRVVPASKESSTKGVSQKPYIVLKPKNNRGSIGFSAALKAFRQLRAAMVH